MAWPLETVKAQGDSSGSSAINIFTASSSNPTVAPAAD